MSRILKSVFAAGLAAAFAAPAFAQAPPTRAEGLAAWERVHAVFSHPRCANCHVGEDHRPMWSGDGRAARPHGMNIVAGASRVGAETLVCSACHGPANSPVRHGPPGAPVWHLPPVDMRWFGLTSAQICAQIKDPARNGGRTIDGPGEKTIVHHIDHDALVHWGWAPGPGRQPAPFSREELVAFIKSWAAAGAPCPDDSGVRPN